MPDDGRPHSNNLLDLAPPDIAWFQERSDVVAARYLALVGAYA